MAITKITLHSKRNKTVLNSTPEAPLLFLFVQLVIAVLLLHTTALFSSRIEIPRWDSHTVKKLVPVVTVNIVGLVFNTLCLREVEATFFQVFVRRPVFYYQLIDPRSDRKRLGLTPDHFSHLPLVAFSSCNSCDHRSWYRHGGIFHRRRTRGQPPCLIDPLINKPVLRRIFFPIHCYSLGLSQVLSPLLQQFNHPARVLDQCGICDPHCSIRFTPWRTRQGLGVECQR